MPKRKVSAKTTPKKLTKKTNVATKQPTVQARLATSRTAFWVAVFFVMLVGLTVLLPRSAVTPSTRSILAHVVTYKGQDGKNALTLLKAHHQVGAQQFSIGAFVTSIDGISAPPSYYWAFTVNSKASDVGADQYVTKNADTLSWQLQRIQ